MQKPKRKNILAAVFSSVALGSLLAAPGAVRADDVPIIVGKPIIKKDPPQPKKANETAMQNLTPTVGQS